MLVNAFIPGFLFFLSEDFSNLGCVLHVLQPEHGVLEPKCVCALIKEYLFHWSDVT